MIGSKRIKNLEFKKARYSIEEPEKPAYNIDYYYPNPYYGRESEFPEDPDNPAFRVWSDNCHCRVYKDNFKIKECCFSIASFEYVSGEGCYVLQFIADRPFNLTKEEREIFWELLEYGNKKFNLENNGGD